MAKSRLHRFYNKFISSLSFSAELRKMRRELNAKIDQPEIITSPPPFHPQAANRWFKRRRISIAESYLMVVRDLDSRNSAKYRLSFEYSKGPVCPCKRSCQAPLE